MIQRPRNRQGRNDQNNRNNGRRESGNGKRGREPSGSSFHSLSLPTFRQVVAGAHVSIVLKIDQSTGRQVQGTVAETLTSGDHPRGIKVRLVDGRVGRVQRIVTEAEANAGSKGLNNLDRNGQPNVPFRSVMSSNQYQSSVGAESGSNVTPVGFSLGDFFPHDLSEQEESDHEQNHEQTGFHSAIQTCPVCFDFEGDEVAVSHHVNSHFA